MLNIYCHDDLKRTIAGQRVVSLLAIVLVVGNT